MLWYEVNDYLSHYYDDMRGEYKPCVIYRTVSKTLAERICKIASETEQPGVPFVEEVRHPLVDIKFELEVSDDTLREWYRTERRNWEP